MPPTEPEAKEIYELGMAALPEGDSEARVRLLGIRAGWLFGYPREDVSTDEELRGYADAGVEAADVALRMGLPDLASGALDSANAAWSSVGYWSETLPLIERRAELLPQLTDVLEIGDCYAMLAWALFEMGRYEEAARISDDGIAVVAGKGPNVELHLRAWLVAILHRLGRWDEALAEHALVQGLLGDRREDPPYFVTQGVAAAATIHQVRGERAEADRLQASLVRLASAQAGRVYSFLRRLLIVRGELDLVGSLSRPTNWRVHANDGYEADAEFAAAMQDWDRVPALLVEIRPYARRAETAALEPFADRLEGRAALAGGDDDRAVALLLAAADRFDRLGASWERALTQLDLAKALAATGERSRADDTLAAAIGTFETLRAAKDLATARTALEDA
jgi:tetratricopeptide (TPR) repeat protein